MTITTWITRKDECKVIKCDNCKRNEKASFEGDVSREAVTFNEYPSGAGLYRAHRLDLRERIDLCDLCVLSGYVVFRGSIVKSEAIVDEIGCDV